MVSVPIGGIRVDLQLNSAAFIRDIAKSNAAIQANTARTTKSLGTLQSSIAGINKTFLAFLTVREINKVIRFTDECLKLAATIKGPLGIAAKDFLDKTTAFENSFKVGVAQGFMDQVHEGLKNSNTSLTDLAAVGVIVGNLLGKVFTTVVNFFTHDIPEGVKTSIASLNTFVKAYNDLVDARERAAQLPSKLVPDMPGSSLIGPGAIASRLPMLDPSTIESSIKSWINFANVQSVVAGALQTTGEGQRQLNNAASEFATLVAANNALWESTRTPLEQYAEALDKIKTAHAGVELATRATAQAQLTLAETYTSATAQATGALAAAFAENKAIQIANAVVNTAAGVVKALGDPKLPFPLDFAVAASIAAAGAAQIATILAAKPGGSGNIKSPKGTAAAGAASTSASGGGRPAPTQTVSINIVGDVFGPEHFRKIVAGINGVQRDGTALLQVA